MPEDSEETTDIHVGSDASPILTKYEPNFQRVFARGTLLQMDENDQKMVEMSFWSSKEEGIEIDEQDISEGVGYQLETEVVMHWDSILRLRDLIENYIEDNAPDRFNPSDED